MAVQRLGSSAVGWGSRSAMTPEQLDLKRRRELGLKHFTDISDLIAIAAQSTVRVQRLPPAPRDDEHAEPVEEFFGPAQSHVQHFKNRRAATAAGKVVTVQEDEPYVSDSEKKRLAGREYVKDLAERKASGQYRRGRGPSRPNKAKGPCSPERRAAISAGMQAKSKAKKS